MRVEFNPSWISIPYNPYFFNVHPCFLDTSGVYWECKERIESMRIPIVEARSLWFMSAVPVYDIAGQYIGTRAEYHSRFDREHYSKCDPCYEDHLDFVEQCRMDEMDEMLDMQEVEDE